MTITKPPTWLDKTASQLWQQLHQLVDIRNPAIYQQLAMLCSFYSDFRIAIEQLKQDGSIIENAAGNNVSNPALGNKIKASDAVIRLAKSIHLDSIPDLSGNVGECSTLDELMQ